MQRVRLEAAGSHPDARRQRPLPILRHPPGPHVLGLRPAAHYKGALAVCSVCGETRPCHRISSGSPICRNCRTRPPRPCFRCGRDRPVQAEWPVGPACVGCYEHVRRHPGECAGCRTVRPLIGSDDRGRPVCGPCAGAPGLDYTCRECGRGGEIHSGGRCFGCVLAERAHALLAGPGGEVSAELHPLFVALTTVTNPATVVTWLGKPIGPFAGRPGQDGRSRHP